MKKGMILAALVLSACAKSERPMEPAGEPNRAPEGWQEFGRPAEPSRAGEREEGGTEEARERADFDDALRQLRESVTKIRGAKEYAHSYTATALKQLATALTALPGAEGVKGNALNIETYASRIEKSGPSTPEQAEWVRAALDESVTALTTLGEGRDIEGYGLQLEQVRGKIDGIRPSRPLLEQKTDLADTFSRIADVLDNLGRAPMG